ncbi:MAG: response regulator [Gammaproteobacteria bacterium]
MNRVTVLIIDDDELDRYLLTRDLSKTGIEAKIFESTDGAEALNFLRAYDENKRLHGEDFPPVLIFLDINMPRVNGFEFLKEFEALRNHDNVYHTCVVMMFSSSERPDERKRALAHDFVADFIVKGRTRADELEEKILKLL